MCEISGLTRIILSVRFIIMGVESKFLSVSVFYNIYVIELCKILQSFVATKSILNRFLKPF